MLPESSAMSYSSLLLSDASNCSVCHKVVAVELEGVNFCRWLQNFILSESVCIN